MTIRSFFSPNVYPKIAIDRIKHPNRFYAFPIFGMLVKIFMLIPVFFWVFFVGIAMSVLLCMNSFVVLFTGNYWKPAFTMFVLFIRLSLKTGYFLFGLSNTYPGFDGKTHDFTIEIPYPKHPNRLFAIPLLGGIVRFILLIPYILYTSILQNAQNLASVVASFPVLFTGKYPESLYEMVRDVVRLNFSTLLYFSGLSDSYPSFWISMKHKNVKLILIILAVLYFLINSTGNFQHRSTPMRYQNNFNQFPISNNTY